MEQPEDWILKAQPWRSQKSDHCPLWIYQLVCVAQIGTHELTW
jgi:hypothetical protein